jgi:hypothetical protein
MRMARSLLIAGIAVLAGAAGARADVRVSFDRPEHFTDAGLSAEPDATRDRTLREIAAHLERLGTRYLSPGQTLTIEVRDLDLAGRQEPWRLRADHVRVLGPATWPRIVMRYTLTGNGATRMSAEETVADLDYLSRPEGRISGDRLRYEKAMLDDWFRARFATRNPA